MIVTEIMGDFVRTYSDLGVYIHGGYPEGDYEETIDPIGMNRTYTETNIPIIKDYESEDAEYAEIGRIMMGVIE